MSADRADQATLMTLIVVERERQDQKWGRKNIVNRSVKDGLAVLMEEVGEVARAELEDGNVVEELVQVAAVAMAMAEAILRRGREGA